MSEQVNGLNGPEMQALQDALCQWWAEDDEPLCRACKSQAEFLAPIVTVILDAREAAWRGEVDGLRAMLARRGLTVDVEPASDATTSPSAASEASGGVDGPRLTHESFRASLERGLAQAAAGQIRERPDLLEPREQDPHTDWPRNEEQR